MSKKHLVKSVNPVDWVSQQLEKNQENNINNQKQQQQKVFIKLYQFEINTQWYSEL